MSNVAIYPKGKNEVIYFLRNAIRSENTFRGENGASLIVKPSVFDVIWTDDLLAPVFDSDGNRIGWDKAVSDITPSQGGGLEIAKSSHKDLTEALGKRRHIADLTFEQVETYVENNVTDLASAKAFLKVLARVVLAIIKIQDKE